MTRRARIAALSLVACLTIAAPSAARAVEVGMGDQKASMFADPLFRDLGLKHVRLVISWEAVLKTNWERDELDAWMYAARAAGQEPLVAFQVSRTRPRYLPSMREFDHAFTAFRQRYPWVTVFTPWNEANFRSQPTAGYPQQAANFYNVMRARCPECRVVAADVLDADNLASWIRTFRRHANGDPQLWGLHNYHEVNGSGRGSGLAGMLREVPGEVWLTETGGLVYQVSTATGTVRWPYDEARAARATAKVFQVARENPRVGRVYLYHWSAIAGEYWDSGLVGPDGRPRPALNVLRAELGLPPIQAAVPAAPAAARKKTRCGKTGSRRGKGGSKRARRASRACRCRTIRRRARAKGKRVPRVCRNKKRSRRSSRRR